MINTNSLLNDKALKKIIRKKEIWVTVKAHEQEYGRLQKQIDELEQAKKDVSFKVQKLWTESQQIAEWLDDYFMQDQDPSKK